MPETFQHRRTLSPITRRILAINLFALGILVAGLLYLGKYRESLIEAEFAALETQAEMFAGALGEGAVTRETATNQRMVQALTHQIIRRLAQTTGARARLFDDQGQLIADSRLLLGRIAVEAETLPPPRDSGLLGVFLNFYDRVAKLLLGEDDIPVFQEKTLQHARDYPEATKALGGETVTQIRRGQGRLILSVAVPVQRYKQVLGALVLSKGSEGIDARLLEVRTDILAVFFFALAITVLLSLYLARTIARPILRLAQAAERVRRGNHRQHTIPDFKGRQDEIGELAASLNDMTEALWLRLDAIERFAADVAHEIKNPLTSLRSAVETASHVNDPEQLRALLAIIRDDIQRLDRLISDISDASRVDAEMSRGETVVVDLGKMLETLADIHKSMAAQRATKIHLVLQENLTVIGHESRLGQVFRNLMENAVTFSPMGATITVTAVRETSDAANKTGGGDRIEVTVEDEGRGLPPGKEKAIFGRFYSERPETEKFGTHSGLGLSIAKQIVEAHRGTIRAENRKTPDGEIAGARFIVRLPAAQNPSA
ncbi:MAG: stimulus-sensing domain-containing protein [Rhodospirillales bacterium]